MINLVPLTDSYSIYQFNNSQNIPSQVFGSGFYSITKTKDEVSIVTNCRVDFKDIKSNKYWKGFKVEGVLDFSSVGIINEITKPLKENNISVFVISTFNTDYLFVQSETFDLVIDIFTRSENINLIFL